jgi:hypothetical protein
LYLPIVHKISPRHGNHPQKSHPPVCRITAHETLCRLLNSQIVCRSDVCNSTQKLVSPEKFKLKLVKSTLPQVIFFTVIPLPSFNSYSSQIFNFYSFRSYIK